MKLTLLAVGVVASLGPAGTTMASSVTSVSTEEPARIAAAARSPWRYVSPVPGSRLVSPSNNIAIRLGPDLDRGSLDPHAFAVVGSRSGSHPGSLALSDDSKTLVFTPAAPFAPGESVHVTLAPGLRTAESAAVPPLDFEFAVAPVSQRPRPPALGGALPEAAPIAWRDAPSRPRQGAMDAEATDCDTLPPGYPETFLVASNDPDSGAVFLAPFSGRSNDGHLMVLDNDLVPLFYRRIDGLGPAFDFKRQPNGLLTYFLAGVHRFYALDSTLAVVDSFSTGNGYQTDLHDLQLLPNGHALLMSYDFEPVDMSQVVEGGRPDATVTGLILQELDTAKNVVFQWRSWDHFAITDLESPDISLTDSLIDYVHGNAVEQTLDGNWLLSSRHMNEITKIDRQTGDILWRLGPHAANNQFTIVNDAKGFSHQHDIRMLPNGHITMFDNGNFVDPLYSRAVEYELDETNKIATEVWEYRYAPDLYGAFMGNVQRHPSGASTISWGGTISNPKFTELHPDGSLAFAVGFVDSSRYLSYRGFRAPWQAARFTLTPATLDFGPVGVGLSETLPLTVRNRSGSDVTITCILGVRAPFSMSAPLPFTLAPGASATLNVTFAPTAPGDTSMGVCVRQVTDHELVAQTAMLRGSGLGVNGVATGGRPALRLSGGRPNPFSEATAIDFEVPRDGHVRLEVLDLHGRRVAFLADGFRPAGSYQATWTAGARPAGVYFCRLTTREGVVTRKLVVER